MDSPHPVNLDDISNQLKLARDRVQAVVELLDEGNTVPFITRFRKDRSQGLDERQVREIQSAVARQRQLAERRQTVLKSIESQEKLTDELRAAVESAKSVKLLEDIYLPYKPKKKTLATVARQRGLEPFALQIISRDAELTDLEARANDFIDAEKELTSVEDVLQGVSHLVAEHISELVALRDPLRKLLQTEGTLTSKRLERTAEELAAEDDADDQKDAAEEDDSSESPTATSSEVEPTSEEAVASDAPPTAEDNASKSAEDSGESPKAEGSDVGTETAEGATAGSETAEVASDAEASAESSDTAATESEPATETAAAPGDNVAAVDNAAAVDNSTGENTTVDNTIDESQTPEAQAATSSASPEDAKPEESKAEDKKPATPAKSKADGKKADATKLATATSRRIQRREARRRKREKLEQSFKDYFDFREPVTKIRHHRILAINRGERTKVLRVRIEVPPEKLQAAMDTVLECDKHPHAEFYRRSAQDSLNRLLVPSLEREVRRELSDRAEEHAVSVFAKNLRALLLQPPIRGKRVLAVDPGFRSGCKLVALDEFGTFLTDTLIHLIGKDDRTQLGRERLVEMVRTHKIDLIAIGNGTACRESERLVADVLSSELAADGIGYIIVNEAGASIYSTSNAGRTEHPNLDPTVRSAISIGRRTIDPLSELVKIDPASIGVGMYQHDVKSKHLRESLDAVVESCVNFVGVDVNSASPALLARVSGLNQLTAKRIYEFRQQNGPFATRQQLKEVPGIGDATFVQAAGFLKIVSGENPLDGTWIHPESYETAERVLEAIDSSVEELRPPATPSKPPLSNVAVQEAVDQASKSEDTPTVEDTPAQPTEEPATTSESSAESGEQADKDETPDPSSEVTTAEPATGATQELATAEATTSDASAEPTVEVESPSAEPAAEQSATNQSTAEQVSAEASSQLPETPALQADSGAENSSEPKRNPVADRIESVKVDELVEKLGVGKLLLEDILSSLARPGRDPREDFPPPVFRHGILKLDDLKPGMELSGTVLNVVDFGAFVDIGMNDSGLIHVSRLADTFVSDPHEVVSVGDVLRVWVVGVDNARRRVSLTAIEPGTEKPRPPKGGGKSGGKPRRPAKKRPAAKGKDGKDGKGNRRHQHGKRDQRRWQPKPKPKPVVPITKDMADGKEPMRTFGDLKQFFDKEKEEPKKKDDKKES